MKHPRWRIRFTSAFKIRRFAELSRSVVFAPRPVMTNAQLMTNIRRVRDVKGAVIYMEGTLKE